MQPGQSLQIEIFTEDTSKQAFAVMRHLLRRIFLHMEPNCQTQRVLYGPLTREMERARGKMFALHGWKSKRPVREQARRVASELGKELARLLLQGRFVFYHLDSDSPWDQQAGIDVAIDFHDIILPVVAQHLTAKGELVRLREQFFFLVPCRGIESWLFRHYEATAEACKATCLRRQSGAACQCEALVASWHKGEDAGLLEGYAGMAGQYPTPNDPNDRSDCPKDKLCIQDQANEALARRFAEVFDEVYLLGFSLYQSVCAIENALGLQDALRATLDQWDSPT